MPRPLYLLSLPGLSRRLLAEHEREASAYRAIIDDAEGELHSLIPAHPAIGASSQATLLSGHLPQVHGITHTPSESDRLTLSARTFWRSAKVERPELTVTAALWDPALQIDSPGWGRKSFPGHHRNGERVLTLLRETSSDVTAIRMKGIASAATNDGPRAESVSRRMARLGEIVQALFARAKERDAMLVICGEYALVESTQHVRVKAELEGKARVHCEGQVAHVWPSADASSVRKQVQQLPGVSRVYSGSERDEIGLNHPSAGELIALSDADKSFESSPGACGIPHADPLDQPALISWNLDPIGEMGALKPNVSACELAWYLKLLLIGERYRDAE